MNLYLIYKTLHILFMVSWFAGIFYLPRLFVYHVESGSSDVKNQLSIMEKKLFKFITPLGILALIFGVMMGLLSPNWSAFFSQSWILAKLVVVVLHAGKLFEILKQIIIIGQALSLEYLMKRLLFYYF